MISQKFEGTDKGSFSEFLQVKFNRDDSHNSFDSF